MSDWVVEQHPEIGYAIRVRVGEGEHHVDAEVLELLSLPGDPPEYQQRGAKYSPCCTSDIEQAQRLLHGSIKWDGCSNIEFDQEDGALHFCGRRSVVAVGLVLGLLYDLARRVMPKATVDDSLWIGRGR